MLSLHGHIHESRGRGQDRQDARPQPGQRVQRGRAARRHRHAVGARRVSVATSSSPAEGAAPAPARPVEVAVLGSARIGPGDPRHDDAVRLGGLLPARWLGRHHRRVRRADGRRRRGLRRRAAHGRAADARVGHLTPDASYAELRWSVRTTPSGSGHLLAPASRSRCPAAWARSLEAAGRLGGGADGTRRRTAGPRGRGLGAPDGRLRGAAGRRGTGPRRRGARPGCGRRRGCGACLIERPTSVLGARG